MPPKKSIDLFPNHSFFFFRVMGVFFNCSAVTGFSFTFATCLCVTYVYGKRSISTWKFSHLSVSALAQFSADLANGALDPLDSSCPSYQVEDMAGGGEDFVQARGGETNLRERERERRGSLGVGGLEEGCTSFSLQNKRFARIRDPRSPTCPQMFAPKDSLSPGRIFSDGRTAYELMIALVRGGGASYLVSLSVFYNVVVSREADRKVVALYELIEWTMDNGLYPTP